MAWVCGWVGGSQSAAVWAVRVGGDVLRGGEQAGRGGATRRSTERRAPAPGGRGRERGRGPPDDASKLQSGQLGRQCLWWDNGMQCGRGADASRARGASRRGAGSFVLLFVCIALFGWVAMLVCVSLAAPRRSLSRCLAVPTCSARRTAPAVEHQQCYNEHEQRAIRPPLRFRGVRGRGVQ